MQMIMIDIKIDLKTKNGKQINGPGPKLQRLQTASDLFVQAYTLYFDFHKLVRKSKFLF